MDYSSSTLVRSSSYPSISTIEASRRVKYKKFESVAVQTEATQYTDQSSQYDLKDVGNTALGFKRLQLTSKPCYERTINLFGANAEESSNDYGYKIKIPEELSKNVSTRSLTIQVLRFINGELYEQLSKFFTVEGIATTLSAFYLIYASDNICELIVSIQHCVKIERPNQLKYLRVISIDSNGENPEFRFLHFSSTVQEEYLRIKPMLDSRPKMFVVGNSNTESSQWYLPQL